MGATASPEESAVSGAARPWWRLTRVAPGALAAFVATIAYFGVWRYGYASDDVALVVRFLRDGWAGVAPLLDPRTGAVGSGGYEAYYRPAWVIIESVVVSLFGPTPWVTHLINYVLFAVTAALVAYLVELVTNDRRIALWAGVVYAIHPIHTLNVIWISGRTDLLATFGVLGALVAMILRERSDIPSHRTAWLIVSLLSSLLGLAGKEMAYLLPLMALVTERLRRRIEGGAQSLRHAAFAVIPVAVLTVAWAAFVLLSSPFVSGFGWSVGPKTVLMNWIGAVTLFFAPLDYEWMLDYALGNPAVLGAGIVVVLAAGVGAIWYARRDPVLLWGLAWIGIGILPLYRLTMRWYLLLPSVGAAVVIGVLVRRVEQTRVGRLGTVAGVLVLVAFALVLCRERVKWNAADAISKTALASLMRIADTSASEGAIVVVSSPFKAQRMPVFGGNTESFLRVATGEERRVDVIAGLAVDRTDASVSVDWMDTRRMRISVAPERGMFFLPSNLNDRGRAHVGDQFAVERGTATVVAVDDRNQPVTLDIELVRAAQTDEIWVTFAAGGFQLVPIPDDAVFEGAE